MSKRSGGWHFSVEQAIKTTLGCGFDIVLGSLFKLDDFGIRITINNHVRILVMILQICIIRSLHALVILRYFYVMDITIHFKGTFKNGIF